MIQVSTLLEIGYACN